MSTVDVHIVTYNHAKYIRQCLDSVLNQKTDFDFRVIIGDDCSTDGTQDILMEYQKKCPNQIELHLNNKNLGPKYLPGLYNFLDILRSCKSEFVAMIEGDDYWTDSNKLNVQVQYLKDHSEASGCFTNAVEVDENGNIINDNYYKVKQSIFTQDDCVRILRSGYATSSLMFRGKCIANLPAWYSKWTSDYALDILITEFGDLHNIPREMSAYRIHGSGIWMGKSYHENMKQLQYRYVCILRDKDLKRKYGDFFESEIKQIHKDVVKNYYKHKAIRSLLRHYYRYYKLKYF